MGAAAQEPVLGFFVVGISRLSSCEGSGLFLG